MFKTLLLIAALFFSTISYGEDVSEEDVKAAFIYHFINFTEWEDKQAQYNVCIPDNRTLRETAAEMFGGKVINDHTIEVVNHAEVCHVLVSDFVPVTQSILTIGPLDKGALLEFRKVNSKLKFAANLAKIKGSKLKISSQMLKLAILD